MTKVKIFYILDEPNAPPLKESDVIPLREAFKTKIQIGDFKKNEIILDNRIKENARSKTPNTNHYSYVEPLIDWESKTLLCKITL